MCRRPACYGVGRGGGNRLTCGTCRTHVKTLSLPMPGTCITVSSRHAREGPSPSPTCGYCAGQASLSTLAIPRQPWASARRPLWLYSARALGSLVQFNTGSPSTAWGFGLPDLLCCKHQASDHDLGKQRALMPHEDLGRGWHPGLGSGPEQRVGRLCILHSALPPFSQATGRS